MQISLCGVIFFQGLDGTSGTLFFKSLQFFTREVNKNPLCRNFYPPVRFQKTAKPGEFHNFSIGILGMRSNHFTAKGRVRTFVVIVFQKFFHNISELGLRCQNKVIQTLLLEGLYKGFHIAVALRRSRRDRFCLAANRMNNVFETWEISVFVHDPLYSHDGDLISQVNSVVPDTLVPPVRILLCQTQYQFLQIS